MANVLNGNTFFVDTQYNTSADDLVRKNTLVTHIIIRATAANGRIVLTDVASNPAIKLDLEVKDAGDTKQFDFEESPVLFPNGIRAQTLSNAKVTVVIRSPGG